MNDAATITTWIVTANSPSSSREDFNSFQTKHSKVTAKNSLSRDSRNHSYLSPKRHAVLYISQHTYQILCQSK